MTAMYLVGVSFCVIKISMCLSACVTELEAWDILPNTKCNGGNTLTEIRVKNMQECITKCSLYLGCVAVEYREYKPDGNCYIKSSCPQAAHNEGRSE